MESRELPEPLRALADLAFDLRWSWNHTADELWSAIDPASWEASGNPWLLLQSVSQARLNELASNAAFLTELARVRDSREHYLSRPTWFESSLPNRFDGPIAYFSMEFGVTEALPIYSGGLGILAGDFLKAASDLGVPVVGVGLLYQQGYFRQVIDAHGEQREAFPYNDPAMLPISELRDAAGEWVQVSVKLPGRKLRIRAWEARVGRVSLYLLDSNDPLNHPADRAITAELYGGDKEMRLQQEIVLGIGGWLLLQRLGLRIPVCHLNEGHAAFAILQRARAFGEASRQPFHQALRATRAGTIFTTHTPVSSGFDVFDPALFTAYFREFASEVGISMDDLLALGRDGVDDPNPGFSMAYLAARGSGAINGVSALHERVSQRIFQPLFPRWPEREVPISHVTNGVHVPSWDCAASDDLWTRLCGKDRWLGDQQGLQEQFARASDEELWEMRGLARSSLARELAQRAPGVVEIDLNLMIVGFARRFTPYKRITLLLADPGRLARLLADRERPVQLLVSGKAHPQDTQGRDEVRKWVEFTRRPDVAGRAFFIEDYDISLAAALTEGVDLWINTPRRPWEACGTSGMKLLVNGGLNLSERDGWWDEAYAPEFGWALDGQEHDDAGDEDDAERLYALLEREVVPAFYARDARGIPGDWIARVRSSSSQLTPRFSANRMVREYAQRHYTPAADAFAQRTAENGALGARIEDWARTLGAEWHQLHISHVMFAANGENFAVDAHIYLGEIDPEAVQVELYAEPRNDETHRWPMKRGDSLAGALGGFSYRVEDVPANRALTDFTVRAVPYHPNATIPLESPQIAWQSKH